MKRLLLLLILCIVTSAAAQPQPPYLYYYSRMLGGIIIERADGTDSRIIGQDVIPAGLTGIAGPGWSPSGRFFAGYGVNYGDRPYYEKAFVIDSKGQSYFDFLRVPMLKGEWSPEDDLLFLVEANTYSAYIGYFWLLDPEENRILAQVGLYTGDSAHFISDVIWDSNGIIFYVYEEVPNRYFKVSMQFDGTVLKEPATEEVFQHNTPFELEDSFSLSNGDKVSPSGIYQASKRATTTLKNLRTGEEVTLPPHSQGTVCRDYLWNDNEEYIITLDGTLLAGGGCGGAVLGVTDYQCELWRELGGCSWDSVCTGWLPPQVDVSSLPAGQSEPIQLDPVTIEPSENAVYFNIEGSSLRLRCDDRVSANRFVVDIDIEEVVYALYDTRSCPYRSLQDISDEWLTVTAAYHPEHQLLATSLGYGNDIGVDIWSKQDDVCVLVSQLTSQGFELEFTPDGKHLRARNVKAWKIYSVEDILRTAISEIPLGN